MGHVLSARRIAGFALTWSILAGTLAACTSTARISDVYMAIDSEGDRRRNVFFTDTKEIHCVVEMGIGRPGVTVEAIVRQLQSYDFIEDRFFETDRVAANAENSPKRAEGIQKLDVSLTPGAEDGATSVPFPPGRFQCEAYLDGELQQVAIFNIDFPPCPTAEIKRATECYGYYKDKTTCPRYGVTSRDTAKCRCSDAKGWECDP